MRVVNEAANPIDAHLVRQVLENARLPVTEALAGQ